jgi:UDP-N-acetylmuramate: L-alanyl-gamma-D-glutamyl-meso-diaminopimelate ligase
VRRRGERVGKATWSLIGLHNLENALAALIAAEHAGVAPDVALQALAKFKGVKRRLERLGVFAGITVYEDFAHHPTAIAATLRAVRSQQPQQRLLAVIEPRSNTMRMGIHRESLPLAFDGADKVFVLASRDLPWNPEESLASLGPKLAVAWDRELSGLAARAAAGAEEPRRAFRHGLASWRNPSAWRYPCSRSARCCSPAGRCN